MELQLTNNFFKTLSFVYRRVSFYKASPLIWDENKKLLKMQDAKTLKWLRLRFIYCCIYCAIGTLSVFRNWSRSDAFVKSYGMFGVSGYTWAFPCYYMIMYHGDEVVRLLNCMIKFEQMELAKLKRNKDPSLLSPIKKEWFMKLICRLMSITNHWCFVFHSNSMLHPCFPINVGYNFSDYCNDSLGLNAGITTLTNPREILVRGIIVGTGLVMWVSICSNVMCISIPLIIQGHCISNYIRYYTR